MNRLTLSIAAVAAVAAAGAAGPAPATAQSHGAAPGSHIELAQAGPYDPAPAYGSPRYGSRPYGVVSPGTVRLRLLARGYYAIRRIHYVPHRPDRVRRGPGAHFPGHYVAFARRLGVVYRFHLNPYTGRPYARIRVY